MLTQHRDDLIFREPLPLHLSVLQSRPDSNSRWRKNSGAGHSTEKTAEEPYKNVCRDITAKRIRLLNASDKDSKYAELVAEFAYLRTRQIDFENFDYDIQPSEVWNILETIHDLPLTEYVTSRQWNEHVTDAAILIYVDTVTKPLVEHLRELADQRRNVFVYAWAPGQILQKLAGRDIEVKPVHETLVKRFQQ
ncbi:MAG: hypothetical protein J0H40_23680 [Rhizobiales bacterium]|nr:hypothetical protein [Hyphomicrobiales bacterium]